MLNQQCEQILDGHNLFKRRFLAHGLEVEAMGQTFARSCEAVLECGHLRLSMGRQHRGATPFTLQAELAHRREGNQHIARACRAETCAPVLRPVYFSTRGSTTEENRFILPHAFLL